MILHVKSIKMADYRAVWSDFRAAADLPDTVGLPQRQCMIGHAATRWQLRWPRALLNFP
jgi:hypothetical protein